MQEELNLDIDIKEALGVSYGMGVDSTAVLVGMVAKGIRPDFILFADVGAEKQSTYDYESVMQQFLKDNGFPPITTVKYKPVHAPYDTIEGNMVMNATLPGATFNRGSCTDKFKIKPQEKWAKNNYPHAVIKKAIGFEAGEEYRTKSAADKAHTSENDWYPLQDWGWTREECKARIKEAGLPVPPKSSCIFCPNMKPHEIRDLTPEELGRVIRVEVVAEPYNLKVEGLWRRTRKSDGRPGSITEYVIKEQIPFVHPDELEWMSLNKNCLKGKRGFTFDGPHVEYRLRDLIGGCKCAMLENHFHDQLVDSLFDQETEKNQNNPSDQLETDME
jgi:hypothetical protein